MAPYPYSNAVVLFQKPTAWTGLPTASAPRRSKPKITTMQTNHSERDTELMFDLTFRIFYCSS